MEARDSNSNVREKRRILRRGGSLINETPEGKGKLVFLFNLTETEAYQNDI
jgi:hypothetical protein